MNTPAKPKAPIVPLICPDCRTKLAWDESGCSCPRCSQRFPYRNGIISFVKQAERFNEGEYEEHQKDAWSDSAQLRLRIRENKLLSLLNSLRIRFSLSGRRDRVFLKEMAGGGKDRLILDLGCGGGRHYFSDYGTVVGIDPVLELLPMARSLYAEVYHGGGYNLPFADDTFDYVVSSDVLGHIPFEHKDQLFAEMHRVLKKGGRTVHLIETDSTDVWFRFAHRYPELFQKYFVDRPGHVGLELPSALRARFLKHGFTEVRFGRMGATVQQIGSLAGVFDNEFKTKSAWIRFLVGLDRWLGQSRLVSEALNLLLEPLACIEDRLAPVDHGSGMMVVFEK